MSTFSATNGTQTKTLVDTINVAAQAGLTFSTSLPSGTANAPYSGSVTVSRQPNASGTMTISVDTGFSLPAGLTLGATVDNGDNTWTADVTGTPTTQGNTTVQFKATDGVQTNTKSVSMAIAAAPDVSITANLPDAVVGYPYTGSVTAQNINGATGAITITVDSLPAGLTLGSTVDNGDGTFTAPVTGTPT
ncbi:MAG TPA: hypothetical protein VFP92_10935 [Rhodanobacteraceae bacterium]|nr:hypothetical protein [Rhodanobacteraceae bacterium]